MKTYDYAKCAKYYRYLLLLVIPGIIVGLLTNERIVGSSPTVKTIGVILRIIINLVEAYFIYMLASEDERYKKSAILEVCIVVFNAANSFIPAEKISLRIIISLVGLAVGVFYAINFFPANADVLSGPDPALSAKWHLIKKLFLILAALSCVSVMMLFAPLLAVLAVLAASIMTLVVYIMELIALSRSSKACALYAEAVGKPDADEPLN